MGRRLLIVLALLVTSCAAPAPASTTFDKKQVSEPELVATTPEGCNIYAITYRISVFMVVVCSGWNVGIK